MRACAGAENDEARLAGRASSRDRWSPLIHDVDDLAAGRVDEIDVVVRVHVAVPGHGRTPICRNRAQFYVGGKPRSDGQALADGDRSKELPHHIVLDARALLRSEVDSEGVGNAMDAERLEEGWRG